MSGGVRPTLPSLVVRLATEKSVPVAPKQRVRSPENVQSSICLGEMTDGG
jgi:hypothetical protein